MKVAPEVRQTRLLTLVLPPTNVSMGKLFYMSFLQENQANSDYLMELL